MNPTDAPSRYRLFKKGAYGTFYIEDVLSRRQTSLKTKDKKDAERLYCHRAVQNQPLVGDSKPASLRCGFHNSYGCWIKRFGSRINEPGTAASPSSRPRRSTVPSTWRCSPRAGMATASP